MRERRNLKFTFYQLIYKIKLIKEIVFAIKCAMEKIQYLESKCELWSRDDSVCCEAGTMICK